MQTLDNGYVFGYNAGVPQSVAMRLIKTDSAGNQLWTYYLVYNAASSFVQSNDGGFVLCGNTAYLNYINSNYIWLKKVDSSGNQLWSRIYGYTDANQSSSRLNGIVQTSDGGFMSKKSPREINLLTCL